MDGVEYSSTGDKENQQENQFENQTQEEIPARTGFSFISEQKNPNQNTLFEQFCRSTLPPLVAEWELSGS